MSNKPFKIKRYPSPSGKRSQTKRVAQKTVSLIIALAVLLGAGYFGAPFVFDNIGKMWQSFKNSQPQNPAPTVSPDIDISSAPVSPDPSPSASVQQTIIYCEVLPNELLTKEKITEKAAQLKAKGVTTAVITLKNPTGNIAFASSTELGKKAVGDVVIDLTLVADTFKENGITSCANLYTFMDKTTPTLDRSTGVKYVGTDYTWLDSAKELGGKPWANPASSAMQEYIYSLTEEILSAGFKEVIYSAVQLPTGHSLDKREFGATQDQLLAQMKNFINTLQTKVTSFGARASFAFDFASVNGEDYAKYMEYPTRLGAENIILTCQVSQLEDVDLAAFFDKVTAGDSVDKVSLWVTDSSLDTPPTDFSGYFVK